MISRFTSDEILANVLAALQPMVDEGAVQLLSAEPPAVTSEDELVNRITKMPALFVMEPGGQVQMGQQTSNSGRVNRGFYAVDQPVALLGIATWRPSQDPAKDVFRPILKRALELIMADPTRGGNAIDTIPGDYAHTGRDREGYIVFAITFTCPFTWTVAL